MSLPPPIRIDVAVCTFRRPSVRQTLQSIAALDMAGDTQIRVLVVDNDDTPSAEAIVREEQARSATPIVYVHAPGRNISIARNACLDHTEAPWLAFIDDDQIAARGWLQALLDHAEASRADAVFGPVKAQYSKGSPSWMVDGDFHSIEIAYVAGEIETGYTCNVLLRWSEEIYRGIRFDPAWGRTGGEDTIYFSQLRDRGAKFSYAPDAIAYEPIVPSRASFRWLRDRKYRFGQSFGDLVNRRGIGARSVVAVKAVAKAAYCGLRALVAAASPVGWRFWTLRGVLHLGVLSRLVGVRAMAPYGELQPSVPPASDIR